MNEYKVELTCATCGEKFLAYKHEKGRKNCSRKCLYESKRRQVKKVCAYCGKEFSVALRFTKVRPCIYCSILCSDRAKDRKWFKTMERTPEHCAKISASRKGSKNPMWKGGVTPENRAIRNSAEYRRWRSETFKRDGYTCLMCGYKGGKIQAHHLDLFSKNPEARFDLDNGNTLCRDCHKYVHSFDSAPDIQSFAFGVV